ncbi:MAG: OsmC family protein [Alphaproteobacteria bacterium]|nr:OsmC family protein [Alphaproteobacteria bacterium]
MSEHKAVVEWRHQGGTFTDNRFSRRHEWHFDGGAVVPASASPHVLGPPMSDAAAVDPEEAFVAAAASCHMLWFLWFAARAGLGVRSYRDAASGYLERNEQDRLAITRIVLRPVVEFSDPAGKDAATLAELHEKAHEHCFIANSITSVVTIEPQGS